MGMIDRYKKKGGFVQLLNLIETTAKDKQEKFLKMIQDESPNWESEVRKKMLSLDKVLTWEQSYRSEVFSRIPVIQLAAMVGGLPQDKADLITAVLGPREKKQIQEELDAKKPVPAETATAIGKLLLEVRKMETDGLFKFEKMAPDLAIPENIEEQLASGRSATMSEAEMKTHMDALNATSTSTGSAGMPLSGNVTEELMGLRRKLVQLTQDNQRLTQENTQMRDKLEQIRKIA